MWLCYLLISGNRTYIGATINLITRLKKHNTGKGAKYTKGRHWGVLLYITGFKTKQQCLSFEKNYQRMCRRRKNINAYSIGLKYSSDAVSKRITDMYVLINKKWSKWISASEDIPLKINFIEEHHCYPDAMPSYISHDTDWDKLDEPF